MSKIELQVVGQLHKHGEVFQSVIRATGFEGIQKGDFVFIHVVVDLHEEPAGQVVEQHGLVHVVSAPGNVVAPSLDVSDLHFFGKEVKMVEGHSAKKSDTTNSVQLNLYMPRVSIVSLQ